MPGEPGSYGPHSAQFDIPGRASQLALSRCLFYDRRNCAVAINIGPGRPGNYLRGRPRRARVDVATATLRRYGGAMTLVYHPPERAESFVS